MGIFGNAFTGWHAIIILVVVLLLFGAAKLPALAKSVGQSMKIFKSEIKTASDDKTDRPDADPIRNGAVRNDTASADSLRAEPMRAETAPRIDPDSKL